MNPWWLTGLIDGEGSFVAFLQKNHPTSGGKTLPRKTAKRYNYETAGVSVVVEMSLTMRADDGEMVKRVQDYFGGAGSLSYVTRKRPTTTNQVGDNVHWTIKRKGILHDLVIPHFDAFPLQSKKAQDFAVWKEIVEVLHHRKGKMYGPEMFKYLTFLVNALQENRKYGNTPIEWESIIPELHTAKSQDDLEQLFEKRNVK